MNDTASGASRLMRLRDFFFRPSPLSLTVVVGIGMIMGLIFWGAFNTGMEQTMSLDFCISCHEMRDTVYQEYKESIHYKNRVGVRAACPDCHVPKDWMHMFVRKLQASQELYGKFVSHWVDTPAKFESHRMELATKVWDTMKSTDSRECRNCHSWGAMDPRKQSSKAVKAMAQGQKDGKTCIDCHKGIAHLLPKEYVDPNESED